MNYENFIKNSFNLLLKGDKSNYENFEILVDSLFSLFLCRIDEDKNIYKNKRHFFINLITQKFILHVFSIKKILFGVSIESNSKKFKQNINDPFSVLSLLRTLIETYLVQNYLSNKEYTEEILNGRFEIWMRYGLYIRGINPETKEEENVIEKDKKSIDLLEKSIKEKSFYLMLSDSKKESFMKTINKEWKIEFDNEKFYPLSWKDLLKQAKIKEGINNQLYNILSWHSHSHSISILQLENMWVNNDDKFFINYAVKTLNMFIAFIIYDIVENDDELNNSFKNFDNEVIDLVQFYNISFRDTKIH